MHRTDVEFESSGTTCRAWFYRPDGLVEPLPCVVMAHGFGATRDASLEPYAIRFAEAGLSVLLFDYRHFGASDGEPRQLVSVRRQLEDYANAVACARRRPGVDATRIAVWGTSFSGGHALVCAAQLPGLAAAVCQCPMMDGLAALRNIIQYAGLQQVLRLSLHGMADQLLALFGRAHYIPTVGPPGSLAMMSSEDAEAGYRALTPPGFRCEVAARVALVVAAYRPVRYAAHARCPVLVQICEHDSVAPTAAAEEAVRLLGPKADAVRYPIGHFEPYLGQRFERSVSDQLAFLRKHLLG